MQHPTQIINTKDVKLPLKQQNLRDVYGKSCLSFSTPFAETQTSQELCAPTGNEGINNVFNSE